MGRLRPAVEPQTTQPVLRHRPHESKFKKVLPWLAAEKSDLFNAYQQTQSIKLESAMRKLIGTGYVASFIGQEPGKAVFVGLYSITSSTPLTYEEYWQIPAHIELKKVTVQPPLQELISYSRHSLRDRRGDLTLATFSNDLRNVGPGQDAPLATGVYHAG